jgi:hypothetical protein
VPRQDRDYFDAMRCGASDLPISNKVLASDRLPFPCACKAGMQAFTGLSIICDICLGFAGLCSGLDFWQSW